MIENMSPEEYRNLLIENSFEANKPPYQNPITPPNVFPAAEPKPPIEILVEGRKE